MQALINSIQGGDFLEENGPNIDDSADDEDSDQGWTPLQRKRGHQVIESSDEDEV